jgi:hypothetical protein
LCHRADAALDAARWTLASRAYTAAVAMTRDEALACQARWRLMGDVSDRETRQQTPADRLRILASLRGFARTTALPAAADDERGVWARFQTLRARLCRGPSAH